MRFDGENLPDPATFALIAERRFQLWNYTCSHGMLLIRSPQSPASAGEPERTSNVDIICQDVRYISAPRHLGAMRIVRPYSEELADFSKRLQRSLGPAELLVLETANSRHHIVLAYYLVRENFLDIFEPPEGLEFAFGRSRGQL